VPLKEPYTPLKALGRWEKNPDISTGRVHQRRHANHHGEGGGGNKALELRKEVFVAQREKK